MVRKLLGTVGLFLFAFTTTVYGQVDIGYLNTQEVLSQLPQRERVEQKLNTFIGSKQQELTERVTAFQDSVAAFQKVKASLSQAQIEQEQQGLSQMEVALQQYRTSIRSQIQQKRASLLKPLFDKMDQAMASIAEEQGLEFVLNETTNTGETLIFYSKSERLDITGEVIQYIKENSDKN